MGTLLKFNIDNETETQKDNKTKDDEQVSKDIQTTSNDLLTSGGVIKIVLSIELNDL